MDLSRTSNRDPYDCAGASVLTGRSTVDNQTAHRKWFTSISDSTPEDWAVLQAEATLFNAGLCDRVMSHLSLLDDQESTFHVTRLEHSLQSATMAYRADRDDSYVACALLHDLGDSLAASNHADLAAAVVRPFVSDDYHFMVAKHAVFQGYYFWHMIGEDRDAREEYRGHSAFDLTVEFCAEFDNPAFDPNYKNMELEDFRPLLTEFFAEPRGLSRPAVVPASVER
jgi:predicted HD phosphohydrolase